MSSFLPPVDITVYHNGFHGDLNETFFVGDVDEEAKKLVQTTYECLMQAIDSGACSCCLCMTLECRLSARERRYEQKIRIIKCNPYLGMICFQVEGLKCQSQL